MNHHDLVFYMLDSDGGKIVKSIMGGEVFVRYNRKENEVIYLSNKSSINQILAPKPDDKVPK